MIVLTAGHIEALMTPKGGYNQATLDKLGIGWPPKAGWKDRLIGTKIGDRRYAAAVKASKTEHHYFGGNTRRRP